MAQPRSSAARLLAVAAATSTDVAALDAAVAAQLQRLVGCGPVFIGAVDPVTQHFTRASHYEIPDAVAADFLAHEMGVGDVVKFRDLAAAPTPVDTLLRATAGKAQRSARWRDVIEPLGWGDELRVALRDGRSTWGFLCLHRAASDEPFAGEDIELVRRCIPALAAAFRRMAFAEPTSSSAVSPGPGVLLLDADYVVQSMTGSAQEWLALLGEKPGGMPVVVMSVCVQAAMTGRPAVVSTVAAGRWITIHASPLLGDAPGGVAVVLEPSHPAALTPTFAAAAGLSPRETQVAAGVVRGMSSRALARAMGLSEHTVNGHLKSIYARTGVNSRAELVARLVGG